MSVPLAAGATGKARIACPHCLATYSPPLVGHACPVCRTPAPGAPEQSDGVSPDDRMLVMVAVATVANLVVLGLLAVYLLQ